jgi:hypothetical protein
VLFQGNQQQQVDSFCAWLRLHAGQVTVLAISSPAAADVLRFLAKVAAAAAAVAAAPMEEPEQQQQRMTWIQRRRQLQQQQQQQAVPSHCSGWSSLAASCCAK